MCCKILVRQYNNQLLFSWTPPTPHPTTPLLFCVSVNNHATDLVIQFFEYPRVFSTIQKFPSPKSNIEQIQGYLVVDIIISIKTKLNSDGWFIRIFEKPLVEDFEFHKR